MSTTSNQRFDQINKIFPNVPTAEMGSSLTSVELVSEHDFDSFYFRRLEQSGILLNQNQIEAVRQTEGPLLIIAGAGTGKTTVLVTRIGYLLTVKQIRARDILLVTFTKKAAKEMIERISQIPRITEQMIRELNTGTFHSVFLRILREQGDRRQVLSSEKFKQLVIKKILKDMGLADDYLPETVLSLISGWKNQMQRPSDIEVTTPIEKELIEVYRQYEQWKEDNQYIDFDDFMLETYFLLKYEPNLLSHYQEKFKYILVDEFQDTSLIQYELMRMLAAPNNDFCVVGDDAQTIYGFRGASSDYILNFERNFPTAKRVILDVNYRSTDAIIGLGNEIIKKNKHQIHKTLKAMKKAITQPKFQRPFDGNHEAEIIAKTILNQVERGEKNYRDFAVIFRTHSVSRAIFDEFVLKKIPFISYGKETLFYENSFVKPVIDLLRLTLNPNDDEAIISICPMFYIKKEEVGLLLNRMSIQADSMACTNKLKYVIEQISKQVKSFQQKALQKKLEELERLKGMDPEKAVNQIRQGTIFAYDKYLEMNKRKNLSFHKEMINEWLNELENAAKKHKSIAEFIAFINEIIERHQQMETIQNQLDANAVKLMTIHQSKGLEFDTVFLIGFIENILPHKTSFNADEQEDRIQTDQEKINSSVKQKRRLRRNAV